MITLSGFRLLLGLTPEGRQKRVNFLEIEWSYEAAVIAKGYECFLEAGFQTMLQTYIQMRTGWPWLRTLSSALGFSLGKGYLLKNGKGTFINYVCKFSGFFDPLPPPVCIWFALTIPP